MKNKIRRFGAVTIALLLICPNALPTALADDTSIKGAEPYVYVNGVKLTEGAYWRNGDVTAPSGSASDYNAHFADGTLYLNNARITEAYKPDYNTHSSPCGIYSGGALSINVSGSNSISDPNLESTNIYARNNLSINGAGKLHLEKGGIYDDLYDGDLCEFAIQTGGDVNVSQTTILIKSASSGVYCNNFTLKDDSFLSIDAFRGGNCIYDVSIENSKLNVVGEESGLSMDSECLITGNSAVRMYGRRWYALGNPNFTPALINAPECVLVADGTEMSTENFRLSYDYEQYKEVSIYNPKLANKFVDVNKYDWYNDSIQWATQNNITYGTGPLTFSPAAVCSRSQIVTLLWRANGSPTMSGVKNPFHDVKPGDFYYDAVLWAVQNGITVGTSASTFSPNAGCTRGQVVTFLYRANGNKQVHGASNPFRDVPAGQYYTQAVLWAVQNGITNGTSATTFSPDVICSRSEIVCFLHRSIK